MPVQTIRLHTATVDHPCRQCAEGVVFTHVLRESTTEAAAAGPDVAVEMWLCDAHMAEAEPRLTKNWRGPIDYAYRP